MRAISNSATIAIPAVASTGALLPPLFAAAQPSERTVEARERHDEHTDRKRREKDDERRRDDDASAQLGLNGAAQIRAAERDMRPGSHALAQEQVRGAAFREEWQNASQSARAVGTPLSQPAAGDPSAGGRSTPPTSDQSPSTSPVTGQSETSTKPDAGAANGNSGNQQSTFGQSSLAASQRSTSQPTATPDASTPTFANPIAPSRDAAQSATSADDRGASGVKPVSSIEARTTNAAPRGGLEPAIAQRPSVQSQKINTTPREVINDPAPGKNESLSEQLVRVVRARINEKHTVATLRLDPPALGSVRMHMDLRDDQLAVRVEPQSELAHRLLTEQTDSLRVALEAAGIRLHRIEIIPPDPAAQSAFSDATNSGADFGRFGDAQQRDGSDNATDGGRAMSRSGGAPSTEVVEAVPATVFERIGLRSRLNVLA